MRKTVRKLVKPPKKTLEEEFRSALIWDSALAVKNSTNFHGNPFCGAGDFENCDGEDGEGCWCRWHAEAVLDTVKSIPREPFEVDAFTRDLLSCNPELTKSENAALLSEIQAAFMAAPRI